MECIYLYLLYSHIISCKYGQYIVFFFFIGLSLFKIESSVWFQHTVSPFVFHFLSLNKCFAHVCHIDFFLGLYNIANDFNERLTRIEVLKHRV